ncbi:MAG: alpha/beta hydrolase [Anaerolineales bacterium]|jgi:pimeloyl-ACP methyl ester carboxylesterase|nr:alpha/beta hydrolase [Anaerolineales bacterium]
MKKWQKILVGVLIVFLLALGIGPFLVPVPPLEGTVSARELADPDSQFVEVNGLSVHYKEMGAGQPVFLLLHGFGASAFSWREVMQPFSELGRVIAYDRPAFGLTSRPMPGEWSGENPYGSQAQAELVIGLMDALDIEKAWLVGNSAGGTVSVYTALRHPERVAGLILVDAAIYNGGGSPAWARPLLATPQMGHLGPLLARQLASSGDDFIRSAFHDPALVTPEILEGYRKPLNVHNWDRALWELTAASRPLGLAERLDELNLAVLVLTGDDDRIVPTEESIRLADEIPNAALAIIPNAGHLPHEEKPAEFMEAVRNFLNR